ncbi:actin-like ATPase domain-containing protein [Hyaloscypha variabilis F]|uniref:Actin-like ATPase domain-containing protein n=1 Tax=Hyaloscypha variabilis (strain UAMH 11265 / GT02V1 / F) TaxID=1149755 RepID=A0A2J6RW79_HYAVF|nr:actin-like ATPase domain-containing protein [Hyaloscypha variabilis F]
MMKKIVVGIDFGTTFSGIAWGNTLDAHINIIQQWPGLSSPLDKSSEKVPTQILYDGEAPGDFKWGYQIKDDLPRHQWFKLDLESSYNPKEKALANRYPHPNNLPSNVDHNAQQLTTDYLAGLKRHLTHMLQLQLGELQAKTTPLQFILTVPAVWSEIAREKTLTAAEGAGLGDDAPNLLVSEPEVAATYALQRQDLRYLKPGDTFVVCDAGGGTVDLISYTVVKLEPVLEVKEAAPGTGGLCGSTYLNRRFQEYLEVRLGQQDGWDEDTLKEAMDHFDQLVKVQYTSTVKDQTWRVPVTGLATNEALSIKKGKLILKSADVKEILEPVIAQVVKLVLEQIRTTSGEVKAVLLVGGFGMSMYLRERIKEEVSNKIEVLQPPYGWSAVVRGAVLKGIAQSDPKHTKVRLTSRIARKHLGTCCGVIFNEKIHSASRKYFDAYDGTWRTTAMSWFIKRGDTVNEDKPYTFEYYNVTSFTDEKPTEVVLYIYCDRTNRSAVAYRDDEVETLARLNVKVGDLPKDAFDIKFGKDDKIYYKLEYAVEITYQSASTKYELVHKGKRYSSVIAEYV